MSTQFNEAAWLGDSSSQIEKGICSAQAEGAIGVVPKKSLL